MIVVWTDQAGERLAEIEDYIARRGSPRRAEAFVDEIVDATTRQPSRHPRSGRRVPEVPGSRLRERIHRGYRVVYRIRRGRVEVITVFEGHRLLPREDLPDSESG